MGFYKGTVQSFEEEKDANGNPRFCRVVLDSDPDVITQPLNIPFYWRGIFGNLAVGDKVYIGIDDNLQGCVIQRLDGDWDNTIRNAQPITATGDTVTQGNQTVGGNVDVTGDQTVGGSATITGTAQAADVKTDSVASINAHTHTSAAPGSPTSAPTG